MANVGHYSAAALVGSGSSPALEAVAADVTTLGTKLDAVQADVTVIKEQTAPVTE